MGKPVLSARTNHDTGLTGILAVLLMIIDHTGVVFFPKLTVLRIIGRSAFPLFAWGIAIGAAHTRSFPRYALRLFLLMIISQPFYMFALNHTIDKLNIFAVLLLGLMGIWGLSTGKGALTALALMLSYLINMDYGFRGVLLILLLYVTRDDPFWLAVCFSIYCVIWGQAGSRAMSILGVAIPLQTTALFALPLMLLPLSTRTRTPRALMYAAYPAHLGILYLLRHVILR